MRSRPRRHHLQPPQVELTSVVTVTDGRQHDPLRARLARRHHQDRAPSRARLPADDATYNATDDVVTQTDGRGNATTLSYATSSDAASNYQIGELKTLTDRENGITTYSYYTTTSSPTRTRKGIWSASR